MLFNSLQFIFFFSVVTTLYFVIPRRFRWLMLLIASCSQLWSSDWCLGNILKLGPEYDYVVNFLISAS